MKSVLIYGDSNVYGVAQFSKGRLAHDQQWPILASAMLGDDWCVVPQGLPGRVAGDYVTGEREYWNGRSAYQGTCKSALPVDYVIIALGTNDLQSRYERSAQQIRQDLSWYIAATRQYAEDYHKESPKLIYMLPFSFRPNEYFVASREKWEELRQMEWPEGAEVVIIDNPDIGPDGVHLSVQGHKTVAEYIANKLKEMENKS